MTYFKKILLALGLAAGLAGVAGVATAQNVDIGINSVTGLQGFVGLGVSLGTPPTTTGSTCASGTLTVTGGATTGKVVTTVCTALTLKLVWTIPALGTGGVNGNGGYSEALFAPTLNGAVCFIADLTHPATITQASYSYTAPTATTAGSVSCTTSAATITAGDTVIYTAEAF